MFKRKNDDEKPKRRPRGWMIFVAIGLMLIGIVGILQSLTRSAPPAPDATLTPLMSFQQITVNSYSMQTTYTIQTSNGTTTTTLQDDELFAEFSSGLMEAINATLAASTSTPLP